MIRPAQPRPWRLTSPPVPKLSENDVERSCLDYARMRGYRPERIHCGRFWTWDRKRVITGAEKGTPDYICSHRTFPAFYLETKRPGGELSADQILKINEIRQGYGIAVAAVDSVEGLVTWLAQHERAP